MAILVILVLIVLWAAVLVPPILRSRNSGGHHGVSDFMDSLRSLGHRGHHAKSPSMLGGPVLHGPVGGPPPVRAPRPSPAPSMQYRPMPSGPGVMSPMQRRRRNVLMLLAGAVGVTFLLALVMRSGIAYLLLFLALAALGGYCYLLVQMKNRGVAMRGAPPKRMYATPVDVEDDAPKAGDNVIVLRRSVG